MADALSKFPTTPDTPARKAFAISANNTTDIPTIAKAIYIGTSGNLVVALVGDTANTPVTFTNVVAGSILPLMVRRVYSSSSATNLIGLV